MLLLPFPPRRTWLRSFWGAFVLYWTVLVSLVLSWFCNSFSYAWTTIIIAVLGLLGFCWPQLAVKAYTMWNGLMLYLEQMIQWAVLSICYYVIIMAVGHTSSSLRLARPASTDSLWRPRDTLAQHAYAHPYVPRTSSPAHQSWLQTYFTWAKRSQNMWALCLLPLLLLLLVIGSNRSNQQLPANIYTLF